MLNIRLCKCRICVYITAKYFLFIAMIAFSERYSLDAKYFKIFIVLQWQLSLPEFVVSRVTHEDNRICKTCRYIVGAIFLADSYGKKFAQFTYHFFTPSNSNYVWGKLPKLSWLQYSFCLNGNDERHYSLILTTPDLMLKLSKYNCLKVCLPRSDCDLSSITKQRRISLICSFW